MSGRYVYEHRKRGDVANTSPAALDYGKKLLAFLKNQQALGGVTTQVIRREAPDGTLVEARLVDGEPVVTYLPKGSEGAMEEVIYLYASAEDGLHVYDLGRKQQAQLITGLGAYGVHDVSKDGKVAYLSTGGATTMVTVRVDIPALTAFGYSYQVKTANAPDDGVPIDGLASATEAGRLQRSPDGKKLLVHFGGSMTTGGIAREGIGGLLLVDESTLAPSRAPIRMTFKPAPMAWAPNSEHFYVGCSLSDDPGDLTDTARLGAAASSVTDYVAKFDAAGVLQTSQAVTTWSFTPDAGFSRLVQGIAASDEHVFVSINADIGSPGGPILQVHTADNLALVSTLDLSGVAATAPPNLCLRRDGSLLLSYGDRIACVTFDDSMVGTIEYVSVHDDFHTWAPSRNDNYHVVQNGPESNVGRPPDNRAWFYNYDTTLGARVVRAYRTLELDEDGAPQDVYALDLNEVSPGHTFKPDFCLAAVGVRAAA